MNEISANAFDKKPLALIFICIVYLLCVFRQQVFPVGIAVGVVHRAERIDGNYIKNNNSYDCVSLSMVSFGCLTNTIVSYLPP